MRARGAEELVQGKGGGHSAARATHTPASSAPTRPCLASSALLAEVPSPSGRDMVSPRHSLPGLWPQGRDYSSLRLHIHPGEEVMGLAGVVGPAPAPPRAASVVLGLVPSALRAGGPIRGRKVRKVGGERLQRCVSSCKQRLPHPA